MKHIWGKVLLFSLLLTLISCNSISLLTIEVQEPASITLPTDALNILVVNNSVPQPSTFGIERTYEGKDIENYPLKIDSVSWATMIALSETLSKSDFFSDVKVYKSSTRADNEWLSIVQFSKEFLDELFDNSTFDAIISIDRLLFSVKESVKGQTRDSFISPTYSFADIQIQSKLNGSIYMYNKEKAFTTFTVSDSLFLKESLTGDSISLLKRIPEILIHDLAYEMGEKAGKLLTPSWKMADRLIYSNQNSRMKEALAHTKINKWKEAENIWLSEYNDKKKPVDKARLAMNIALANEMQDKLKDAHEWATRSKEYYDNSKMKADEEEITLITSYISDLETRIQNSHLLNLQWGITEEASE